MKVIAAYLLAHLGGKTNPSGDDISKILSSGAFEWNLKPSSIQPSVFNAHFEHYAA
jgi:ribosomal protein L12E/L44/L45/RPP1/RPP2